VVWEPTFSERLEQLAREDAEKPPDFRTEGEKRRDARRAEARRKAETRVLGDAPFYPEQSAERVERSSKPPKKTLVSGRSRALRKMEQARIDKWKTAEQVIELISLALEQAGTPGLVANLTLSASLITGGLTAMTVAVALGIGTLAEDILTVGAGIADDPLSIGFVMVLFIEGKRLVDLGLEIFERVWQPTPPPTEPEPDTDSTGDVI
jgi:hypothetical protein